MFLRFCTIVPAFDNPRTIQEVLRGLLEKTDFPIIVVDDGSKVPIDSDSPRVTVLRHPINQGKGRALQTGFREAVRRGFTHALSFDADGQHLVGEVSKLLAEARQYPMALVIGARQMRGQDVPLISRFGRKFSNFWVDRETGKRIQDSQSGMRIYPLFPLQMMRFFTARYDFEIEILIRFLWKGIEVREVPVAVSYDPQTRVSHFRKGLDNFRISILNTVLFFLSLLKLHRSPWQVGLAVGLGVFIGTTPFFGFHTPIAFVFAVLFRLNFAFLWLGTQVSIPPMIPILAALSIEIDRLVFPGETQNLFLQWLDGSLLLGVGLGGLAGTLAGWGAWFSKRQSARRLQWSGKTRGGKIGNGFLRLVVKYFGIQAAYFCLWFIVPYFYFFAPRATLSSLEYWRVVEPEASWWQRQKLVLGHYFTFGKVLLDRLYQNTVQNSVFVAASHGAEHILRALENKKGLIMLSAHVGSWDIAAYQMRFKGEQENFHTVEYQGTNSRSRDFVQSIFHNRQSHAVLDIQNLLEGGKPIGVMGDRPTTRRFELVPFLGKLIAVDITAFRIAATMGIDLLFTFGFRRSDGTYAFFASPAKTYAFTGTESQDVQCFRWAQEYAVVLERLTLKNKQQWFNFYPFFSSLPVRG